ncbi:MAG: hypothetical protein ABEJ27_03970 [Halodesulfurarchaeum sp.]
MSRGQTTLDFLIGTSAFLLAVGFVVAFVPSIINPFTVGMEGHAVTANRAVDALVEDELASPENPYILNESRVKTVFSKSPSDLHDRLGIADSVAINVTLTNKSGVQKTIGPVPPDSRSVTTAWRVVSYWGDRAEIAVRVW